MIAEKNARALWRGATFCERVSLLISMLIALW